MINSSISIYLNTIQQKRINKCKIYHLKNIMEATENYVSLPQPVSPPKAPGQTAVPHQMCRIIQKKVALCLELI